VAGMNKFDLLLKIGQSWLVWPLATDVVLSFVVRREILLDLASRQVLVGR
jgi:hypothetical protein